MGRVFLLRHAQSEFNAGNKEVLDAPLTELGRQQAADLTGHFNKVLCSPMTRAQQTLEQSQITFDSKSICEEVREFKTDNCDFFPHETIIHETEEEILDRVERLKTIIEEQRKDSEKTLLVGHCDTFWYLTSHVKEGERFGTHMENAQLLEWQPENEAMPDLVPFPGKKP